MKNLSAYIFLIINHPSLLGSFLEECELLCPCEIKTDKTVVKINVKPNSWSVLDGTQREESSQASSCVTTNLECREVVNWLMTLKGHET